jgi:large subunit ribosomal protein L22
MDVIATSKFVRQSPRKIRLVTVAVGKLTPPEAVNALRLMPQKAAKVVEDVIQSALANAAHNFKLDPAVMRFKTLEVGEGPTLKRMRARSRGMGAPVLKRTSHIRVILTDDLAASSALAVAASSAKSGIKSTATGKSNGGPKKVASPKNVVAKKDQESQE